MLLSCGIGSDALLPFFANESIGCEPNYNVSGYGEGFRNELSMTSVYLVEGAAEGGSMESWLRQE